MAIPNLPTFYSMKYTDKEGNLTSDASLYNDQTFQSLNAVVNNFNNGMQMPGYTTAEITALEPNADIGTMWFNTDLAKLQVKTASGTIETISSS
jgi:hypothetical protein